MIIVVKNRTKQDEAVKRFETVVKLVFHPIAVPKAQRKELLKGMLVAVGLMNNADKPLMTVRQLAEWLYTIFCLCKTADNQQGITEGSIETELYALMKEND